LKTQKILIVLTTQYRSAKLTEVMTVVIIRLALWSSICPVFGIYKCTKKNVSYLKQLCLNIPSTECLRK